MADIEANESLLSAKKETLDLQKELNDTERLVTQLEDIHLQPEIDTPNTKAVLDRLDLGVKEISADVDEMLDLARRVDETRLSIRDFRDLERQMEETIVDVETYVAQHRYSRALSACHRLLEQSEIKMTDAPLRFQAVGNEIAQWAKASVLLHWAEDNIQNGKYPFENGVDEFEKAVEALPLGIHAEEQKEAYLRRCLGYRLIERGMQNRERGDSYEELSASVDLLKRCGSPEEKGLLRDRYIYLYFIALDEFNRLSTEAFDTHREYQEAQSYFTLRDLFRKEQIAHEDYREAVDERDFRIRFMVQSCLASDAESFGVSVQAFSDAIEDADVIELEVLACLAAKEDLPEVRKTFLADALDKLDFEALIKLFAMVIEKNGPEDAQTMVWGKIVKCKKKRIHLERFSNSIEFCRDNAAEPLKKDIQKLVKDLLRSPMARCACTKSLEPSLHALRGEDRNNFKKPQGKLTPGVVVRPWDWMTKALYVFFLLIFSTLLFGGAAALIVSMSYHEPKNGRFVFFPLVLLFMCYCHVQWDRFDRDERGATVYKYVFLTLAILLAGSSVFLATFPSLPVNISMMSGQCFILSLFFGLYVLAALRGKNFPLTLTLSIIWLLLMIAAIVFIILGIINGVPTF